MESSIEIIDNIVFKRIKGNVSVDSIIESWEELFAEVGDLDSFKGVVSDLLGANLTMEMEQAEVLLKYLIDKLSKYDEIKLAILMNNTQVIFPIIADRMQKVFSIRPFATEKAAMTWINS